MISFLRNLTVSPILHQNLLFFSDEGVMSVRFVLGGPVELEWWEGGRVGR